MVAAAMIGSAVVGGVASSSASSKAAKAQASAANTAADTQLTAAREANELQERIYNQNRTDNEPWRTAGTNALGGLTNYRPSSNVADWYKNGLNREADDPGLAFWQGEINKGRDTDAVFNDFIKSARGNGENINQFNYQAPRTTPNVRSWYTNNLGRTADEKGATFWENAINSGRNVDDVYRDFLSAAKTNNESIDTSRAATWQDASKSANELKDMGGFSDTNISDPDSAYANARFSDPDSAYANPKLQNLLANFSMQNFQEDPGYQYRLEQGNRGVENSAAARGSQLSGATLKALDRFNQNEASNEFDKSFNRFRTQKLDQYGQSVDDYGRAEAQRIDKYGQRVDEFGRLEGQRQDKYNQRTDLYNRNENQRINRYGISQDQYNRGVADEERGYNRLASIAGIGERATQSNAAGATNYANQVSANTINAANRAGSYGIAAGDARASGAIGQANALTRGMSGAYGAYQQYKSPYQPEQQQWYGSNADAGSDWSRGQY